MAQPLVVLTEGGEAIDANGAFLDLAGLTVRDLAAFPVSSLFLTHPSGLVEPLLEVLRRPGATSRGEACLRRADGRVLDVSFTAAWFAEAGRPLLALTVADITLEKCLNCKIHISREKYRRVVDDHPELLVRLLPDTTVTFANEAFARHLGCLPHQVVGHRLSDLLGEDAVGGLRAWLDAVTPDTFLSDGAGGIVLPCGVSTGAHWRRRAIFGPDGLLLAAQLSGRADPADVVASEVAAKAASLPAARLAAEAQARLRDSEDRQRRVLSTLQEGVILVERGGRVLLINTAARAILGLEGEAVEHLSQVRPHRSVVDRSGRPLRERDLPLAIALREGHAIQGHIIGLCREGVGKDAGEGGVVWLRVNAQPILLPGHDGALGLLSFTDVSDLIQAETDLDDNRRRLRAVLDHTYEFIGVLDVQGAVLDANRAALSFIDTTIDAVRGVPFWDTPWWRDDPQAIERLRAAVAAAASGEFVRFETTHRDLQGNAITVDFSLTPVRDDTGAVVLLIPEGRDISGLKETERCLQSAVLAAEAANATKTHFLAHMSHELRTPLNAILGYTEAMMGEIFGPLENDNYREYLRIIHGSGRHLLAILGDLLEVSRIELGQLTVTSEDVPLRALAEEAATILRGRAEDCDIDLDLDIDEGLTTWRCDRRHLLQILLNLGTNGIKFTDPRGRVSIALHRRDGDLLIEVRDTGVGIPEDLMPYIWEPFRQGKDALVRDQDGIGLGLPIVRHLVEAQGGSVSLDSVRGEGTTVMVRLPDNT